MGWVPDDAGYEAHWQEIAAAIAQDFQKVRDDFMAELEQIEKASPCYVTYWDPCNGIGGYSQHKGYWQYRSNAEKWVADQIAADKSGWTKNSYKIIDIKFEDVEIS
jgi:hypothetical protein